MRLCTGLAPKSHEVTTVVKKRNRRVKNENYIVGQATHHSEQVRCNREWRVGSLERYTWDPETPRGYLYMCWTLLSKCATTPAPNLILASWRPRTSQPLKLEGFTAAPAYQQSLTYRGLKVRRGANVPHMRRCLGILNGIWMLRQLAGVRYGHSD